jgi:Flp pilus assembly protein TadD
LLVVVRGIQQGDKALQQGKPAQAINTYHEALTAQPTDSQIMARLVSSAISANRPDLAETYLRQLVAINGWSPSTYRQMANILEITGDLSQSTAYLQQSLSNTFDDIPTLRTLVQRTIVAREWNTAITLLNKWIALSPNDEYALYQLGLLTLPSDVQTGMTYLNRAAADPEYRDTVAALRNIVIKGSSATSGMLSSQIGLALVNLKLWPYAEHAFTTALKQGNNSPVVLAFLGVTQDQQGGDGTAFVQRAYSLAAGDALVNYAAALHWRLMGKPDNALVALSRAAALAPKNPAIAAEIGLLYQSEGRLDYAALWLNVAVALAPDNTGFRTMLATFYADTGYAIRGDGYAVISKIASQSPNDPDVRASMGWALFSNAQFDAAKAELEQALILDPTNVRARYYYAIVLENRGDRESAIDSYLYVYRDAEDQSFKDLAASALRRLGYSVDSNP